MDVAGVRVVVAPEASLVVLAFVAAGVAFGLVSGLTPGLHANNVALVLAAVASDLPGPRLAVGAAMLAAGVVHTFLDVVPTLALGVPDAAMATTALPGHRLVLGGRGREALRLSALGSAGAVALALPLAVPMTAVMRSAYPTLAANLPLVLGAVVVVLVGTEPSTEKRVAALAVFGAATALGALTLDVDPAAPLSVGGVLTPLFAGLFGAPVLFEAATGGGLPEQSDPRMAIEPRRLAAVAVAGTLGGAAVGYLPGVSSAAAAVLVFAVLSTDVGDRGYVVAVSGVNTANTVFALFALVALGDARTGVLVAFQSAGAPPDLPTLAAVVVVAGACGFCGVLVLGDRYLRAVRRADYTLVSVAVCALLVCLSAAFAGLLGIGIFVVSAILGMVPPRAGIKRVHLMGVLIGPLALGL